MLFGQLDVRGLAAELGLSQTEVSFRLTRSVPQLSTKRMLLDLAAPAPVMGETASGPRQPRFHGDRSRSAERAPVPEGLLTRRQVAQELGIVVQTVSYFIRRGALAAVRHNGRSYVQRDTMESFRASRYSAARTTPPTLDGEADVLGLLDVMRLLGVNHRQVVDRLVREGRLKGTRPDGKLVVHRADLEAFMHEQPRRRGRKPVKN
ncbi:MULTISPECIES: helix-turn-helix domain-containing protein [Burkholderiaceae]|uniref:helix-turn-helix domain-containing protein n=1 Tax=Burkholderiaceae TaxID=119060 RepID=UPI00160995D1|nr:MULTISPECIES: helix-turn-helix domain-containing protein [Burkholderiaceae]MBB2981575.1 hypothetical protein [Paraburkholderia tropica]